MKKIHSSDTQTIAIQSIIDVTSGKYMKKLSLTVCLI